MQSKQCIVSFSSQGRENYNKAMLNMISSCIGKWDGDYLLSSFDGYVDQYLGVNIELCNNERFPQPLKFACSHHAEIPYHFKPAMVQKALEKGYEQIIWVDSTIRLIKHPASILEYANKNGIAAFENLGHPLKYWISDDAQKIIGINNEQLEICPQIMACVICFDFSNPITQKIFDEWVSLSFRGAYNEGGSNRAGFRAHRHDQASLSALLFMNNIPLLPYGKLVYPPHHITKEYGEDIYFLNKGVA